MPRLPTLLCAALVAALTARGQTVAAPASPPTEARPFFSRLSGLFDLGGSDLPELDQPDAIKLTLRPHFGDLVRRDYMRVDTGLRWAFDDHFELNTDALVFFTHGLKRSAGYGIGQLSGGAKYVFWDLPWHNYETAVALNVTTPVGHPPIDLTDGLVHFQPSFVAQHLTDWNMRLTVFAGMGLDLIRKSSIPGTPGTNQPRDNSISITGGGVYDVGQLKWTFTATVATTAGLGERTQNFLYLQPGLLWYVPSKYTFHSRTQWIFGLGANTSVGPDGFHFGTSGRLRAEITFRQVLDRLHLGFPH